MGNCIGCMPKKGRPREINWENNTAANTGPDNDEILFDFIEFSCGDNVRLPGDLVVEVLSKLPVKSLIRFQSVCKSWKLLINSRFFIDKHLHRRNPQLGEFSLRDKKENLCQKDDNPFPFRILRSMGACNGLFCLRISHNQGPLLLYNPSIMEFSFLPEECGGFFYGFCYLLKTQEYQITSFNWGRDDHSSVDVTILRLGRTRYFRHVKDLILPGKFLSNVRYVSCGTSMFFIGVDEKQRDRKNIVMCYDMIEASFSQINVPPYSSSMSSMFLLLDVLDNSVVMYVYPMHQVKSFDIWILVIDDVSKHKSWVKYRTVGPVETSLTMRPLFVCGYGRKILCSSNESRSLKARELFYYDLESDQIEDYNVKYPPTLQYASYVESLVSIRNICQMY